VAILSAPISPFFTDELFSDLNAISKKHKVESVHLADFPVADESAIDLALEAQMEIAQKVSSLALSLRAKEKIKVRQPLQKIMVPVLNPEFKANLQHVQDLIISEINVKEIDLLEDTTGVLVKKIKPNFKTIGPKYGKQMKAIAGMVNQWGQEEIAQVEANNGWTGEVAGENIALDMADFDIVTDDIPGWLVASEGGLTVALDITLTDDLKQEGIARELVNRIQNFRKESGLEVTDKIKLTIETSAAIAKAVTVNQQYICDEVLAVGIELGNSGNDAMRVDIENEGDTKIKLVKN